jgi:cytochrome b
MTTGELKAVRVWDLPTRVFHWALVALVPALLVTGKIGGEAMIWHARAGYAVGSLLLFRLAWGFAGGHWSRFASFMHSPRALMEDFRGRLDNDLAIGHTPMGALSVFSMLIFLLLQVSTGLFSDDQAEFVGPLNVLISNAAAKLATSYHKNIGQWVLIALVLLHVTAIAFYHLRKGRNLVGPMLFGDKHVAATVPPSRDDARTRLKAVIMLCASAGLVTWLVKLGG